ncbi:MAG: hypothetical protein K0S33_3111 [Bacteroidetes bacterium]|jgi:uncharacterized membrane protein YphA (DoxX/SURF4 family)|nr:hypothetical protein [Bacteroidota bacterium]
MLGKLSNFYHEAKANRWFRLFTVFCRVVLALGFIPSGYVKVAGERFTGLSSNHPLGHYFDALHDTGFYYTFIGLGQLLIALLLLIPRTALLGAILYLPVILNICVLAYATRFEGTRITTVMVLANLYLLCWDADRLKHLLLFKRSGAETDTTPKKPLSNKFPFAFFGAVAVAVALVIALNFLYEIRPGNSPGDCRSGCPDSSYPKACEGFCDCIHKEGKALDKCLEEYEQAKGREKAAQ